MSATVYTILVLFSAIGFIVGFFSQYRNNAWPMSALMGGLVGLFFMFLFPLIIGVIGAAFLAIATLCGF